MKRSLSIVLAILVFLAIGFMGLRHSLATQTAGSVGMAPGFVPNEVLVRADGESTKTLVAAVKVD